MARTLLQPADTFGTGQDVREADVLRKLNWMAQMCLRVENLELEGDAVEWFENAGSRIAARINKGSSSVASSPLYARLTAYQSSNKSYSWTKIVPDGAGGFSDASPAVTGTFSAFEKSGFVGIELGTKSRVLLTPVGNRASSPQDALYEFTFVNPREFFAVKVTQTGGAAGPPSTWTFSVSDVNGNVIATGVSPELGRPSGVATTAPPANTIGTGYYDAAGVFHLFDSNERC